MDGVGQQLPLSLPSPVMGTACWGDVGAISEGCAAPVVSLALFVSVFRCELGGLCRARSDP